MPQEAHVLNGINCWCEPRVEQVCPCCSNESGGHPGTKHQDCVYCHGSGMTQRYSDAGPFLVVHRINRPRLKEGWVW